MIHLAPHGGRDPPARILGWFLPAAYMAAPYAVRGGYWLGGPVFRHGAGQKKEGSGYLYPPPFSHVF